MSVNRWGQAKREVLALNPLITQRISEGFSVRRIWLDLQAEGKVSVTLQKFNEQVRKTRQPHPAQNKPATGQASGGLVLSSARTVTVSNPPVTSSPEDAITAKFNHNNSPCEGELW
ncbi:MAG: hypothetical protein H7Y60_08330 [Rhodospirillaceae bacterium]|nr:hypothetical protein [Rhodospirillales bacterium]